MKALSEKEKQLYLSQINHDLDDLTFLHRKYSIEYLTDRDIHLLYRALSDAWLIMSQVTTDEYAKKWEMGILRDEQFKKSKHLNTK